MWDGFDPDIWRQVGTIKEMVARRYQTPTKEWPLVFVSEHDMLLVVREWPGGAITAYATSDSSNSNQQKD